MTTLELYVNSKCFERLNKTIEKINMYELKAAYNAWNPNKEGYRKVEVLAKDTYTLYQIGIEMGKLLNK